MRLVNRWWQPYSSAWATQGPAVMCRAWDTRRRKAPEKQAEPAVNPAELRANQEPKAGVQSYDWANLEASKGWAHTGCPTLAPQDQV